MELSMKSRRPNFDTWKKYYKDRGLSPDLIEIYLKYVQAMYQKGYPPIFEFSHLCKLMGRSKGYLSSVIMSPENHYREFNIPKASGGVRVISAPYPALLECQRWIVSNILEKVKLAFVAHGFRKKKSILTNAKYHLKAPNILKIDLEDFFPSISLSRVISIFKALGYSNNVSYCLAKMCTSDNCLPQGAATSPYLSNLAVRKIDWRLYHLCKKCGVIYTRYADDLTFSGNNIRYNFISIVNKIVEEEGFKVNNKKTRLHKRKGRRIVTGISVNNADPKISRKMKRDLRQQVHYVLKYGIKSHMYKRKIRDPFYIQSLYGKLQFWKWVEPQDSFVIRTIPQIQSLLPRN